MHSDSGKVEITGIPAHVESWSVARIPGFVSAVLDRWQREYGALPSRFTMVMCPQVEIDARGGLPPKVYELTDARLRCQQFTGCHKPYRVIIFTGEDALQRRAEVQQQLSWSEGYEVHVTAGAIRLVFAEAVEEADKATAPAAPVRDLRELLESGELIRILE
jgi:hypothetical protein